MADHVTSLADRIMAITWVGSLDRITSRGYLMKEYLRRAAWWAEATDAAGFPFFDIAAAIQPTVRADQAVAERVSAHLAAQLQGTLVVRTCMNALHFAALLDVGTVLPAAPEQPFEPLLVMFERGGGFRREGAGFIEVDTLGIPVGTVEANLRPTPYCQLEPAALDALDGRG